MGEERVTTKVNELDVEGTRNRDRLASFGWVKSKRREIR